MNFQSAEEFQDIYVPQDGEDFFPPVNQAFIGPDGKTLCTITPLMGDVGVYGLFKIGAKKSDNQPYIPSQEVLNEFFSEYDQQVTNHASSAAATQSEIWALEAKLKEGGHETVKIMEEIALLKPKLQEENRLASQAQKIRNEAHFDARMLERKPNLYEPL